MLSRILVLNKNLFLPFAPHQVVTPIISHQNKNTRPLTYTFVSVLLVTLFLRFEKDKILADSGVDWSVDLVAQLVEPIYGLDMLGQWDACVAGSIPVGVGIFFSISSFSYLLSCFKAVPFKSKSLTAVTAYCLCCLAYWC